MFLCVEIASGRDHWVSTRLTGVYNGAPILNETNGKEKIDEA